MTADSEYRRRTVLKAAGAAAVTAAVATPAATAKAVENTATGPANAAGNSCGAVFVEVKVDARYGRVRVTRMVGAYDCGRVLNRKTARSQVIGGMTWGIGTALMEHTMYDARTARVTNPNMSTYLLAVNADVPDLEVLFVDKPDPVSTALGARGFGECPMTGVPAAIGNAIYHATGRRVRTSPSPRTSCFKSGTDSR